MRTLTIDSSSPFRRLIGIGGVGTGVFFNLEGNHTLGRNESRSGKLLDVRDYCKLHIVIHYIAKLLGSGMGENGFKIFPVAKVGDDAAGHFVIREMQQVGIETGLIALVAGKPTLFSVCFQYPDGAGGNITTNNSAAAELAESDIDRIKPLLEAEPGRTIALSVPEVPLAVRRHFLEVGSRAGAFRAGSFLSAEIPAAKELEMFKLLDLVALNESEASELLGCEFDISRPESFVDRCLSFVNQDSPGIRLIVSLGARGVLGFSKDGWSLYPAPEVSVASTAGAGDALLGGVIAGIAAGIPFLSSDRPGPKVRGESVQSALEVGMMLASHTVTSPHTIHPSACLDSLITFLAELGVRFDPAIEQLITRPCANQEFTGVG